MPDRVAYRMGQRFLVQALAVIAIAVGTAILIGGHERFDTSPAFATAKAMPGGYLFWALTMVTAGGWTYAAALTGWHRRGVMTGLFAMCSLFLFFTITLAFAAAETRTTPWTGVAIYGGYSVLCASAYAVGHELRRAGRA